MSSRHILSDLPTLACEANTKLRLLSREAFDTMTVRDQRVAMAKDVIQRIRLGLLKPRGNHVLSNKGLGYVDSAEATQRLLNVSPCEVCARGALLAACVGTFDSFDGMALRVASYDPCSLTSRFPQIVIDTFSPRMLAALEAAFEGKHFSWHEGHIISQEARDLRAAFIGYPKRGQRGGRLEAIYLNVIRNGGVLRIGRGSKRQTFE